jgi:hypothetical protein
MTDAAHPAATASLPWLAWADMVLATHTHLRRRLPNGLSAHHTRFFDQLDHQVELALDHGQESALEHLANMFFAAAADQGMVQVNGLLDLYRALKLHSLSLHQDRDLARVRRALFRELWHLVRRRIQALLGRAVRPATRVLHSAGVCPDGPYQAWCDGSFRQGRGYAGLVLRDAAGALLAEVSVRVPAAASHDTEVQALRLTLATARALGVSALRVHVDAAGLANYAQGTAALKDCVQESLIQLLLAQFDFIELVKVPRLYNGHADALARRLKEPA